MKRIKALIINTLTIVSITAQNAQFLPPQAVTATDGTLEKEVRITWQSLGEGFEYLIFRSESKNYPPKSGVVIGRNWIQKNHISDRDVELNTFYYCFVKARRKGGATESAYSSADRGHALAIANSQEKGGESTPSVSDSLKLSILQTVLDKDSIIVAYALDNLLNRPFDKINVQFYLSKEETGSDQDQLVGTKNVDKVGANSIKRQSSRFKIPPSVPKGTYWLLLRLEGAKNVGARVKIEL